MDLQIFWFILIAILFIGYFFLEGFDFGVITLMPFISKDDTDRRVTINTIGPFWDANEVWLITAGGAMFAAFPHWYATLFSGFYIPLFFILIALILRAVGFEFRSKMKMKWWRSTADQFLFWGSVLPGFLWGVAFTNIAIGLPIGEDMNFAGGLLSLLSPLALLGGLLFVILFTLHGAVFLSLRTTDDLKAKAENAAKICWMPTALLILLFAYFMSRGAMIFTEISTLTIALFVLLLLLLLSIRLFIQLNRYGFAFAATGSTIILGTLILFQGLYPLVMPSSLSPDFHLTIYNASSSDYTLSIMSVVALIFVPIILAYQIWSYRVFKDRISRDAIPQD